MLSLSSVSSVRNYTTDVEVGNDNGKKDPLNSKQNYKKIIINYPYNNRDIIVKVRLPAVEPRALRLKAGGVKKQKGVNKPFFHSINYLAKELKGDCEAKQGIL